MLSASIFSYRHQIFLFSDYVVANMSSETYKILVAYHQWCSRGQNSKRNAFLEFKQLDKKWFLQRIYLSRWSLVPKFNKFRDNYSQKREISLFAPITLITVINSPNMQVPSLRNSIPISYFHILMTFSPDFNQSANGSLH